MTSVSRFWVGTALGVLIALTHPPAVHSAMTQVEVDEAMARGYAAIESQDINGAMAAFESVVKEAPDSARVPEAMSKLGHLQLRIGSSQAEGTLKSLVEKHPESAEALKACWRLGGLNTRSRNYDDAKAAFIAASVHKAASEVDRGRARLEASFVEVMKFFANEYWGKGQDGGLQLVKSDATQTKIEHLETARKEFEAIRDGYAKSQNPEIAAIADAAIGEIYLLGKTPNLAERACWRAIREYGDMPSPLNTLARYGIAQAKYYQGDSEGALEQLDTALNEFAPGKVQGVEVAPKSLKGSIGVWKVNMLFDLGKLDEALTAAREAQAWTEGLTEPAALKARSQLMLWDGYLTSQTGLPDEATVTLESVITQFPGTQQAIRAQQILKALEMNVQEGVN